MDNWHITPRLSVQFGLRYDALPHALERQNLIGNFASGSTISSMRCPFGGTPAAPSTRSSPTLYTYEGIPSYINGTDLAGAESYPAGLGQQRLRDTATPHRILRGSVRQRQDRSPRRLWNLLRAHAGQRHLRHRHQRALRSCAQRITTPSSANRERTGAPAL